jgi:outer membrane immunogenic protein
MLSQMLENCLHWIKFIFEKKSKLCSLRISMFSGRKEMKRIIYGCALALSLLTMPQASAQDCCYGPSQNCCYGPQYDPCCGYSDFNGFYVGGNLGVFTHTAYRQDQDAFLTDNSGWSTNDTSVIAGVQLGYDWQWCSKLFGLVVDWNWTNANVRLQEDPNDVDDHFIESEHHWFTTIRGRAGVALSDALVYVTLGAAVARFENTWQDLPDNFSFDRTRWGWVGGAGAELLLGCSWSVGLEVLYLHFDHYERTFTSSTGADFTFGHSDSSWVGRVILNYRFGDLFCW